ncbi:MAG: prolyl oligopeptidase family serine peptidase [Pirellula sp.]|nr:prolyl oligopeptidase family serine peptidase [Pirellula sp.]
MTISGITTLATAAEPPLLDRQLFFGNPQISGGQLSPDGKMISFLKEYGGIMNIWVKAFDEPFEKARPLTDSQRPLYGYNWTEDGKYILYVKDKDGDENINVFAVDPHEAVADGELPESRNLTPMDEVTAQIAHVSQKNPDLLWVGLNHRDKAWHDLYQLRISTGDLKVVYENTDRITSYLFDWDDQLRLLSRTDEQGTTTLLRKEGDSLDPIYETLVTEGSSVLGWTPDNARFYLETNRGELDLSAVYLMDPKTKQMELFETDPEKRVDFGGLQLDENTRQVISTSYLDDQVRYYWKDATWKANYEFLREKFPGREISFQSSTKDYSKFLIAITGDRYASEAWFFDAKTKELIHQYTPRPELKAVEQHLAPMTPIRYKSSDGLEIPGYLTVPVGRDAKNLPLVVLVHGGPKGPRDVWGYDPEVQFLANRGYAVLQPNYRASGGYGKKFLNAGDGQWGLLMQDDITWGVKHLIDQGIADSNRIGIMGGSYGGYATLAGLAFTPELYTCGVDIVGPSNIFTLLDSVPAYWEAGRAFLYGMVGDPNSEEGKKRIQEASPLFSAEKIVRPLLIIQGANDPRVKQAEADQIVIALRDRGHDVDYLLAEDEGHGFAKPVNQMAMYAEVERFLASKLGGRYQAEMPEDVAKRLAELRVDVAKVTYTNPKDLKPTTSLPPVKHLPNEGTETWDVTLAVQGQEIPMKMERSYRRDGDRWVVESVTEAPFGTMKDSGTYSASFTPVTRSFQQGDQAFEIQVGDGTVEATTGGSTKSLAYEGAMLCVGPARDAIVSGIDWKDGDSLVVSVVDLMRMQVVPQQLKVEGDESIDGVDCLKVTLTDAENLADKTTIWIDTKQRKAIRVEQVIPAFGNAKMTMKLNR